MLQLIREVCLSYLISLLIHERVERIRLKDRRGLTLDWNDAMPMGEERLGSVIRWNNG